MLAPHDICASDRVVAARCATGSEAAELDAKRAIDETGCAGVMVGRGAIAHPWLLGECRALLDEGIEPTPITYSQRLDLCRSQLAANVEKRGELRAIRYMRRYYTGYLNVLPGGSELRHTLNRTDELDAVLALFDEFEASLADHKAA